MAGAVLTWGASTLDPQGATYLGVEGAGVVEEADAGSALKPGQKAVLFSNAFCGACRFFIGVTSGMSHVPPTFFFTSLTFAVAAPRAAGGIVRIERREETDR